MKRFRAIFLVSLLAITLILIQFLAPIRGWTAGVNRKPEVADREPAPRAHLSKQVTLRGGGGDGSVINLKDGHDLITTYSGQTELESALKQNLAHPLSLASADFDEDVVPDLISGYGCTACSPNLSLSESGSDGRSRSEGLLTLHRGNVDAIYPNTSEAEQRKAMGEFTDAPFLSPAQVFDAGIEPDFIGAGDFDADGHYDMVIATAGGQLKNATELTQQPSPAIYFNVKSDPNAHFGFDGSRSMTLNYATPAESLNFSSIDLFGSSTQIGSANFFNFAKVFDPRMIGTNYSSTTNPNPEQGAACLTPPPNMVSWYPGDGDANDIQGTNHGTRQGGATATATGKVGQAFSFNGTTGYVSLGNPEGLKISGPLTIDAWINPSVLPANGQLGAIVTKWAQDFSLSSTS
ncbi:MAG: hypothetical protein ACR2HX_14520, partial [Pyrinomonadaceae bacterium]